jgi:hypothetical protein
MTSGLAEAPRLSDLSEAQRSTRFGSLQQRLLPVWSAMGLNEPGESIVVVPSVATSADDNGAAMQALEERFLFLLLLLRQPRLRVIYLTGRPVPESIVSYYLALLPGVIPHQARRRLHMVAVNDGSPRPLAAKLLERPRLLGELRALIPDAARCHLVPYSTTTLERDLALTLGVPLYGTDPGLLAFGTKTGCRRLFAEAGVRHPLGHENLSSPEAVVDALAAMRAAEPGMVQAIVKLNEGVSGAGNAVVDLHDLPAPGSSTESEEIRPRVLAMELEADDLTLDVYLAAFAADGGIVEERITGTSLTSPSVQMRALPDGQVELLSTHDQVLGGASGQRYLGCVFPANVEYAAAIAEPAMVVGRHLARLGVIGRFAVDFVVVRDESGTWTPYAIELNLRKGGTTHPFLTLQFLTDGSYDGGRGQYLTPSGDHKHLVATDHLEDDRLRVLTTDDLFDIVATHRLHFDQSRQTGVVFHMISCLTEVGRLGLTAVGDTSQQAWELYQEAQAVLLREADRALQEGPVVG